MPIWSDGQPLDGRLWPFLYPPPLNSISLLQFGSKSYPGLGATKTNAALSLRCRSKSSCTQTSTLRLEGPRPPVIRAEVYGELRGSQIKLHRRGTSNAGETSRVPERTMGSGWGGVKKKKEISARCENEGCVTPKPSPLLPPRSVVFRHTEQKALQD